MMASKDSRERFSELTEHQLKVLKLFYDGASNAAIAKKLWITESTVRAHMHGIRNKLGVEDNRELLKEYGPLLDEKGSPPAPSSETDQSEPTPEPAILGSEASFVQEPPQSKRMLRWLLVGVIVGSCSAVILTVAIIFALRGLLWPTETPQATQVAAVEPVEVTREVIVEVTSTPTPPQPTPTSEPTIAATSTPTPTPVPPSPTPAPTDTPTPTSTSTPTPTPTDTPVPTPTTPENTPPGSILAEGESWRQNGVRLRLDEVYLDAARGCTTFMFNLFNDTDHTIVVTLNSENFSVVDNLDRKWRFANIGLCTYGCSGRDMEMADTIEVGERFDTEGCGSWKASFDAFLTDTNVDEIIVTVNVSEVSNARWRIPIYN